MRDYDIFRVTCKDGQAFDRVWAHMTGQGVVYVRRDENLVATLGPHSACTIERIEGLSVPVHAGPPEAMLWGLGGLAIAACIAIAVVVAIVTGGIYGPAPPCPVPNWPPPPLPKESP